MDYIEYIDKELYICIPVLYFIGNMIKKSNIPDKWIPLILGALGVFMVGVYKFSVYSPNGSKEIFGLIFSALTQGILCASGSVYANNIIKQVKKDEGSNDEKNT